MDDVLNHLDVVTIIIDVEPLTALIPIEKGHMFFVPDPVPKSLASAVFGKANVENVFPPKLDQFLIAQDLSNCCLKEDVQDLSRNWNVYLSRPIVARDEF